MNRTAILYHAHCADGFGAAWAAHERLGDSADYIPVQYGSEPPDISNYQQIYLLDFSYPRDVLEQWSRDHTVKIIDHHKSAQEALADFPDAIFDMDHSGAWLAWHFFHPTFPVPPLLEYVQDRDLWRWEWPKSREVSAGLWSLPQEFDVWREHSHDVSWLARDGAAILRYMQTQVDMICAQTHLGTIGGYSVPIVNATNLWSEIGEELLKRYPSAPFAACYFDLAEGKRKWSLRSEDHRVDVSMVARSFGGGGHRNAAGFVSELG
jgi:oligoribonuclease NrnB/cAMP/cGMP phosphodiesterase (DHH superfamily)